MTYNSINLRSFINEQFCLNAQLLNLHLSKFNSVRLRPQPRIFKQLRTSFALSLIGRNGPKVDPDKNNITDISSVKRAVVKQAMGTLKLQLEEILVYFSTTWTRTTHFRWITSWISIRWRRITFCPWLNRLISPDWRPSTRDATTPSNEMVRKHLGDKQRWHERTIYHILPL